MQQPFLFLAHVPSRLVNGVLRKSFEKNDIFSCFTRLLFRKSMICYTDFLVTIVLNIKNREREKGMK
jgi:hypothetical protein